MMISKNSLWTMTGDTSTQSGAPGIVMEGSSQSSVRVQKPAGCQAMSQGTR